MVDLISRIQPVPVRCTWEITLACNLKCSHCGSSAGKTRPEELNTAEALNIVKQLADEGCSEMTLLGGEPLLRSDWPIIASSLIEHGIETSIVSNGLSVDSARVKQMVDIGVTALGLSIDGLEQTHDELRGRKGSFLKVMKAMDYARSAGLATSAVTVVMPENIEELDCLSITLDSEGFENWQLQLPIPTGRFCNKEWLSPGTSKQITEFIYRTKGYSNLQMYAGCNLGYLGVNDEFIRTANQEGLGFWSGCYAGVYLVAIRSNGDVTGCLTMPPEWTEGNLKATSLNEIWNSRRAFLYNRQFSRLELGDNCVSCNQSDFCRGGCRSMSYYMTGSKYNYPCCELQLSRVDNSKNN
jgi:radical SAM protein with 4Fe4S-binding SPASM domain